jgi:tetratricopeptide (TPR) repeat protein
MPIEIRDDAAGASELVLARSRRLLEGGELQDRLPFQLGAEVLSPSPDTAFPPTELLANLQLWGVKEPVPVEWRLSRDGAILRKAVSTVLPSAEPWARAEQKISLEGLADGIYSVEAILPFARRTAELEVEASRRLDSVRVLSRESFPAGHGRLRFQRGVLFARMGDAERAIEEMSLSAERLPRDLEVHLQLAVLLSAKGRHQEAFDSIAPLLPLYPREPDLLVLLGFTSLELDRLDQAISYYERAVAERPGDARLQQALSEARARKPGIR